MDEKSAAIREVIAYLNERTGSRFRPNSDGAVKHIGARLDEGRTLEDFRLVIDSKVIDWLSNPPWDTYLRPRTLFGTKFDSYLEAARKRRAAASGSGFRHGAGELVE